MFLKASKLQDWGLNLKALQSGARDGTCLGSRVPECRCQLLQLRRPQHHVVQHDGSPQPRQHRQGVADQLSSVAPQGPAAAGKCLRIIRVLGP